MRYLENFWRCLELFSRISRNIFRPNLGIFVSEPSPNASPPPPPHTHTHTHEKSWLRACRLTNKPRAEPSFAFAPLSISCFLTSAWQIFAIYTFYLTLWEWCWGGASWKDICAVSFLGPSSKEIFFLAVFPYIVFRTFWHANYLFRPWPKTSSKTQSISMSNLRKIAIKKPPLPRRGRIRTSQRSFRITLLLFCGSSPSLADGLGLLSN